MPILREFFDMYDAKVADLRAQRIPKNLGDSELRILAGVHEFGASGISAVALRSRVSQPYVSKVVKSLQRRGLVSSQKSPDDARLLLISLTAEIVARARELVQQ